MRTKAKTGGKASDKWLRDWLAGQALPALIAKLDGSLSFEEMEHVSKEAFAIADTMLEERDK